jgi:hypothetical protein
MTVGLGGLDCIACPASDELYPCVIGILAAQDIDRHIVRPRPEA